MGIDRVLGVPESSPDVFSGRSDTMLLINIDPDTKGVSLLSIPRDTQVEIPTVGTTKINDANATGGPALAARVVSRTLNDVPIDRYVRVSTNAFRELVDLLGGIDVYVPQPMQYTDVTQKLKIDLPQGWQTLNGDQAEQFARFRHDAYGDIGRVQRQQSLLKALRDRLTNPTVITRVPQIIRVMQKYVDTNLSPEEFLALANFALKLDQQQLKMVMLPGRFSTPDEYVASYWILNPEGRDRVMQQYFKVAPLLFNSDSSTPRSAQDLQIAVQNASGQPEIGHQVADLLKSQGFNKVYVVENWPDTLRETQVIVQGGDLDAATLLQQALKVGRVEVASTGDIDSDLTVRVGEDWLKSP
jgi:polyisoprenyl-teichoic acid--peptidoglycan teichoic acid transferase